MTAERKLCRIRIEELYERAYNADPKAAANIYEMWDSSFDFDNRKLVLGL